MRLFKLLLLSCLMALAGCASSGREATALDSLQYAWSAAIRWGDFGGAQNLVDPAHRAAHPLTPLELARYEQVQISAYRDVGSDRNLELGTAVRDIEIGVVNRHTLAERTVRYREQWRWDEKAGTWWLTNGLPDLWAGE
jgi:hypothetical protein